MLTTEHRSAYVELVKSDKGFKHFLSANCHNSNYVSLLLSDEQFDENTAF